MLYLDLGALQALHNTSGENRDTFLPVPESLSRSTRCNQEVVQSHARTDEIGSNAVSELWCEKEAYRTDGVAVALQDKCLLLVRPLRDLPLALLGRFVKETALAYAMESTDGPSIVHQGEGQC